MATFHYKATCNSSGLVFPAMAVNGTLFDSTTGEMVKNVCPMGVKVEQITASEFCVMCDAMELDTEELPTTIPAVKTVYATLPVTEEEFIVIRSACTYQKEVVINALQAAKADAEKVFYAARASQYDALLAKLENVLIADTSQDAE